LGFETDPSPPAGPAVKNDSNYTHSWTNATIFGKVYVFVVLQTKEMRLWSGITLLYLVFRHRIFRKKGNKYSKFYYSKV